MSTKATGEADARPTLVLLSPIGLDAGCWQWIDLPGRSFDAPEHPGHGRRARTGEPFDLDDIADEVLAGHEGPLHLAGVSMGAMVAMHAALRQPDRVRSLFIAGTGPSTDAEAMRSRAEAAEAGGMEAVVEETLERWFTPASMAADPQPPGVAYARRTLLALDPGAFADGWRAIATLDVVGRLEEIGIPTTVLAGSGDAAAPPERMRAIADAVPNARIVVVDGGHMLHLERPAKFSAALIEHLRGAEPG